MKIFLQLYYMPVKVTQSYLTLCNPWTLYSPWTSPGQNTEWIAFPFSRGSSQTRDQNQVSCIAGRFFTSWATRERLSQPNSPQRTSGPHCWCTNLPEAHCRHLLARAGRSGENWFLREITATQLQDWHGECFPVPQPLPCIGPALFFLCFLLFFSFILW